MDYSGDTGDHTDKSRSGTIAGSVTDSGGTHGAIYGAEITIHQYKEEGGKYVRISEAPHYTTLTNRRGHYEVSGVAPGAYVVECWAWSYRHEFEKGNPVTVAAGSRSEVSFLIPINLCITIHDVSDCEVQNATCDLGTTEKQMVARAECNSNQTNFHSIEWRASDGASIVPFDSKGSGVPGHEILLTPYREGTLRAEARARGKGEGRGGGAELETHKALPVLKGRVQHIGGNLHVTLDRTTLPKTDALWPAIRNRTRAISFGAYREFINRVLGTPDLRYARSPALTRQFKELGQPDTNTKPSSEDCFAVHGVGAFQVLKTATQAFLLLECGVRIEQEIVEHHPIFDPDEEESRLGELVTLEELKERLTRYLGAGQLPYLSRVIAAAFPGLTPGSVFRDRVLTAGADCPCLLELIWSYWHEEGMLVQTMNAISRRFQNIRAPGGDRDPLAHLEIDPLRPLNNLLWGYIQDEQNLLTVRRRAYEYDHHYGLTLYGKAVALGRTADSRSKFLEGFHNLLHLASVFFKEDNDTTVIADGFPLLNALKEVHLLLAQGAHNQFGDLPWTARAEMLMQQWLLARSEMREFLQSRAMVPYKEGWMAQVDTMKTIQGWSDVTVTHFRDMAAFGEQLLLSIRYGDWIGYEDENKAKTWARYFRADIQGYLHAYGAATGIHLANADSVDATMPAIHLQKRLAMQQRGR